MKNNIVNDNLLNDQSTVDVGDFGTLQLSEVKPDGSTVYDFAQKDTAKYKKEYISAVKFLAAFYINKAKDRERSLDFFRKWQAVDVNNAAAIQNYIDQIEKMPAGKPATKPATNPRGTGQISTPKTGALVISTIKAKPKALAKV